MDLDEVLPRNHELGPLHAIRPRDLLVSIGTSAVVYPAAKLPLFTRQADAHLVEGNPEPTALSDADRVHPREPASSALAKHCASD
jgi:NAD-dependent deacetylase